MAGESEQSKGRVGALLAKRWLDRTTRVRADWVNPDRVAKTKLTLKKAHYETVQDVFSFDLGGQFREGDFEGETFLAECKNYEKSQDLPKHFRAFLAHCYRAVSIGHFMADHFFWIAFAPHGGTLWEEIASPDKVRAAVIHKDLRDVNFTPEQNPDDLYDSQIGETVSDRIWMLILSERQVEHLTLSQKHHGVIEEYIINNAKEIER
ncbi:hypothetical protein H7I77_00360 [Mycolicibacterium novocastrense]|uniref:4933402E13Rik protein n=1 Tax=Mycolicibacterium novocastrense TaxID=59813 RepID=A0AAW5SDS4_MYCNV|nr:hypothetical protein [Mycolicibacterium novocastrense]MCV7021810.1 hypothetical protein [Mycolicibacterium novocastrense]GAT11760.1 4933402E13Rik protein [Mycolicibacterium novocastrense]